MVEILPSAAYLRTTHTGSKQPILQALYERNEFEAHEAPQRVWSLLETPQTIETICRVLRAEYGLPADTCSTEVKSFLAQLYREGLIELSPDS